MATALCGLPGLTGGTRFPCWTGPMCSGVSAASTTEQQARDAWAASVPASAQPIGPRS